MSISATSSTSSVSYAARAQFKPPSFDKLDGDSSGSISLDELIAAAPKGASETQAKSRAQQLLKAMDSDGSGDISSTEKNAFDSKMADQRQSLQFMTQQLSSQQKSDIFSETDTDGSGGVSLEEFSAGADSSKIGSDGLKSLFAMIDTDGDGSVNETESSDFFDKLTSALDDEASSRGPKGPGGPGGPGGAGSPPPGGPTPDGSQDSDDTSTTNPLLALASSAYKTNSSTASADWLASIRSLFSETA